MLAKKWEGCWRTELKALATAVERAQYPALRTNDDWDLDSVWTLVDYYSKLHGALDKDDFGGAASVQLRQAVVAVFGRLGERVEELFSPEASTGTETLRRVLEGVAKGDTVASLNWDTLAESILSRLGRKLSPHGADECRFVKPHGSLSWIRKPGQAVKTDEGGRPVLKVPSPRDVSADAEPLILGAVPFKSELIEEVQGGNGVYELVLAEWRALCEGLKTAGLLVAVGYSFPPEDEYGMFLMREALKERRAPLGEVVFYEVADQAPIVTERILRLLPVPGTRVTWRGPIERGVITPPQRRRS